MKNGKYVVAKKTRTNAALVGTASTRTGGEETSLRGRKNRMGTADRAQY